MNPPSDDLSRRTLDGTVRVFLAEALILPTGLLATAYLTRRLGPANFGIFALAATLIVWVEWTIASMFNRATFLLVAEAKDWRPVGAAVSRAHLVLGLAAMLTVQVLSRPIAAALQVPDLARYLVLFALDIPLFTLAQAHRNILVGLGRFRERALTSAGRWVGKLLLVVLLVQAGLSITGAVLGSIGASIIELGIGRWYVRPPLWRSPEYPWRPLLSYAAPLFLFALCMRAFDKIDLFAVRALGGSLADAGTYNAAQNLSVVPGIFALSFTPVLMATLTQRLSRGDETDARAAARNAMRVALLLLPIAGLTAGAAPGIVELVMGGSFRAAADPFRLLVFGQVALVSFSIGTAILSVAGKAVWTVALATPLVAGSLLGDLVLIPRIGPVGASLSLSVFAVIGALATTMAVYRVWRILPPVVTLARSLLITAAGYAATALWPASGFALVAQLLLFSMLALLLLLLLGEFDRAELGLMRSLVSALPESARRSA